MSRLIIMGALALALVAGTGEVGRHLAQHGLRPDLIPPTRARRPAATAARQPEQRAALRARGPNSARPIYDMPGAADMVNAPRQYAGCEAGRCAGAPGPACVPPPPPLRRPACLWQATAHTHEAKPPLAQRTEETSTPAPARRIAGAAASLLCCTCTGSARTGRRPTIPAGCHCCRYIEVSEEQQRRLYYLLVESQKDAKRDPLLVWLTGVGGQSSLDQRSKSPAHIPRPPGLP
jgi:hypothetical protein